MRIIETDACVSEGAAFLAALDPRFEKALGEVGQLPLRRKPDGFAELLSAIVSQQVSVASAEAVWRRLNEAGLDSIESVSKATEENLRACGLSRQKIRYSKALADAGINYDALRSMPTADVVKELTKVPGIGPWTAEIYAMFSLGHADVFAPGDLAMQEAARLLFELDERPTEKQLRVMAKDWSPWQSVAARLLWAYYQMIKNREGIR